MLNYYIDVSKAIPFHVTKACRGGGGGFTAPLLFNLDTKWRRVVDFTPRFIYSRKRTAVTIGPQTWSGLFVDEESILLPLGFEF